MSVDDYHAVNAKLGIDPATGSGDWPSGLLSHVAAAGPDGAFFVVETWDSEQSQEAFLASRLGEALGQSGVPAPIRAEWPTVVGQFNA